MCLADRKAMSESAPPYELRRSIPREKPFDIIVAGGGPAGTAAAIQAGRLGARVLLLEASGALDGMGTQALVSQWSNIANGESMVVGGGLSKSGCRPSTPQAISNPDAVAPNTGRRKRAGSALTRKP